MYFPARKICIYQQLSLPEKLFLSFAKNAYVNFQPHQYPTLFMITLIICFTSQPRDLSHEPRNELIQNKECTVAKSSHLG